MDEVDRRRSRHPLPVAHQGGGNRLYVDPERSSGGHDEYNGHPRGVSSTESRFETRPSYQAEPYRMPPRDPEVHRGPRVHGYQIHEASMYNAPSDPHINPSHESRPPYIGSPRGQIRPRINGNHNNNDRYGGGSSTAPYSTHSRRRDIGLSTRRARHDEHRQANGQHDWDDSYNDSSTNVSQERR